MNWQNPYYPPGTNDRDIDARFGCDTYVCEYCMEPKEECEIDEDSSEGYWHVCKECAERRSRHDEVGD